MAVQISAPTQNIPTIISFSIWESRCENIFKTMYLPNFLIMFTPHHVSHMSHVTCHMSCVMGHVSFLLHDFFFYISCCWQCGGASRWRVCYQGGLPPSFFLRQWKIPHSGLKILVGGVIYIYIYIYHIRWFLTNSVLVFLH